LSPSVAKWVSLSALFMAADLTDQPFDIAAANASVANMSIPALDPRTSEDCLLLDVFVPQKLFDITKKSRDSDEGAPSWFGSVKYVQSPLLVLAQIDTRWRLRSWL
jgi:hypothetical protein